MADVQGPGKNRAFWLNQKLGTVDLGEAIAWGMNTAVKAVFALFGQDWDQTAVRRGAFRPFAFMPIAASPAAMAVTLLPGYGLVNNGDDLDGAWISLRLAAEHDVAIAAAHPTLDRYDVVYLETTFVLTTPTATEFRDPVTHNLSPASKEKWALHAGNFGVLAGTPGAGDPGVTRLDAYTLLGTGRVPLAVVRVAAGATSIPLANIQDVRELFEIKRVRDDYSDNADAITQLGDMYPAMGLAGVAQATSATGVANMPVLTHFYDQTDGGFKIKKPNGDVVVLG